MDKKALKDVRKLAFNITLGVGLGIFAVDCIKSFLDGVAKGILDEMSALTNDLETNDDKKEEVKD